MRERERRPPSFRIIRLRYTRAGLTVITMLILLMIGKGRIGGVDLSATALVLSTFCHLFIIKERIGG